MITCPQVKKSVIRGHYDLSTLFYRLLWGPHIHHGLWREDESSRAAQVRLTDELAELAAIGAGQRILDIGCGMGASSIHLCRTRKCQALGVTLSRVQKVWATAAAMLQRQGRNARFRCADAEQLELPPASADVVWSVECTEHLFDKAGFFQRAGQWLKPGGRMAICAWLEGRAAAESEEGRQLVMDVCEGFFCPSLGTSADYQHWMTEAGLEIEVSVDWTQRVWRTWQICHNRVRRTGVRSLAKLIDRNSVLFLDRFETILRAYQSGAMEYGCFIARKAS